MHSSNDDQCFDAQSTDGTLGDEARFLLQLQVCCACFDWISSRTAWTARFRLQIVHEARSIELIHWFDTFEEAPMNVGTRPTEIVTRKVPFAGVVRWDEGHHGDH